MATVTSEGDVVDLVHHDRSLRPLSFEKASHFGNLAARDRCGGLDINIGMFFLLLAVLPHQVAHDTHERPAHATQDATDNGASVVAAFIGWLCWWQTRGVDERANRCRLSGDLNDWHAAARDRGEEGRLFCRRIKSAGDSLQHCLLLCGVSHCDGDCDHDRARSDAHRHIGNRHGGSSGDDCSHLVEARHCVVADVTGDGKRQCHCGLLNEDSTRKTRRQGR
mmetsp:Transcript_65416/g.108736  ORF Transcript_65416/g.108736 Transcript_65416/m.108736 type:complete len:222 (+) Transcript_65416:346-1011(+)